MGVNIWEGSKAERVAVALEGLLGPKGRKQTRVTPLGNNPFVTGVVEIVGIPDYINDVSEYEDYGLTETGWYIFARITPMDGSTVTLDTVVTGAAGYILNTAENCVDVAIQFEVAAMTRRVQIIWGDTADTIYFKATDLAIRNLDYRTTFYVYDAAEFATFEYALATDATFAADKSYFILNPDTQEYEEQEVIIGDPVPADTYYVHSKLHIEGLTRNVTYRLDAPVDCPVEFALPAIDDEDHGVWFEIRFHHTGSYSSTLIPPSDDVKVASEHTQAESKGINMVDLHYSNVGGNKVWRFMNTHSTFTIAESPLDSIEFRTPPDKVTYVAGETLDLTGAAVIATFEDGHKENVTATATFTPASDAALTTDVTELVASFTKGEVTKTATVALTVTAAE